MAAMYGCGQASMAKVALDSQASHGRKACRRWVE